MNTPNVPEALTCEICKKPAIGVASSCMGPISHAYCRECLVARREVWTTLVAGLIGCEKGDVADWAKPTIAATLEFYKKTEDDLWREVKELAEDYNKVCAGEEAEEEDGDEEG